MPDIVHNIRPPKAADIPLPENLQVPESELYIPTELGTRILHILYSESCDLGSIIRDLTDYRAEIDALAHLFNLSVPPFNGASTSQGYT